MRLIRPSYEILSIVKGEEILKNIELAGRTCYKSEDKITGDSARKFVQMIVHDKKHESVIEHEKVTVKVICDRGVSHEIVRHRIASYSQESTRYCNYSKDKFNNQITYIIPLWLDIPEGEYNEVLLNENGEFFKPIEYNYELFNWPENYWLHNIFYSEKSYKYLTTELNWQPQQARSVLPNSLKTEIVITYNLREWRHFFKMRTSKAAHPQMREIACPMLDEFKELIPIIFDDINYEK